MIEQSISRDETTDNFSKFQKENPKGNVKIYLSQYCQ